MIKRLFDVPIGINYDKKDLAVDLTISRKKLVEFCLQRLGLKQGNKVKQQVDIPVWIKKNKLYLESIEDLRQYFSIVNSSNPKM